MLKTKWPYHHRFYKQIKLMFSLQSGGSSTTSQSPEIPETPETPDIKRLLKERIRSGGPVTIGDYMKYCLCQPSAGYYMRKDVFGADGDFTTSPEISQIFCELLGVWCLNEWLERGDGRHLQIVELGPGRGTLADDLTRALRQFKQIENKLSLHLVEISDKMTELQMEKLCDESSDIHDHVSHQSTHIPHSESQSEANMNRNQNSINLQETCTDHQETMTHRNMCMDKNSMNQETKTTQGPLTHQNMCTDQNSMPQETKTTQEPMTHHKSCMSKYGIPLYWYKNFKHVPDNFSCFIAQEFFDALPIRKFQLQEGSWSEVCVDYDATSDSFSYVLSTTPDLLTKLLIKEHLINSRSHIEVCLEGAAIAEGLATHIATHGGAAIIADYGHGGEKGDTFRDHLINNRSHIEVCPEGAAIVESLATHIATHGGAAIIADYGHGGEKGDTFRGFKNHRLHNPLIDPGSADLTADVDFSYLQNAVSHIVSSHGPLTQQSFLSNMGIALRLQVLMRSADEKTRRDLVSGVKMLMDPEQMGLRFKFMAMTPKSDSYIPAGFREFT